MVNRGTREKDQLVQRSFSGQSVPVTRTGRPGQGHAFDTPKEEHTRSTRTPSLASMGRTSPFSFFSFFPPLFYSVP